MGPERTRGMSQTGPSSAQFACQEAAAAAAAPPLQSVATLAANHLRNPIIEPQITIFPASADRSEGMLNN